MGCDHHWTVTSPCPKCQAIQIEALEGALRHLKIAVGAYAAKHKVDRCPCTACDVTRGAIERAERVLGG
jgi:hypothetical protein